MDNKRNISELMILHKSRGNHNDLGCVTCHFCMCACYAVCMVVDPKVELVMLITNF